MDVIVLESRHARRNVRNTQSRWYHRVFPGRAASDGGRLPMRASPMASGLRHSAACARRGGLALATVASRAVASGLASQPAADGRGKARGDAAHPRHGFTVAFSGRFRLSSSGIRTCSSRCRFARARARARAESGNDARAVAAGPRCPRSAVSQKTCKTFRAAARLTGRPIVPRHARDVLVLARRRGSLGTRLAPAQWRGRLVRHSRSRVW